MSDLGELAAQVLDRLADAVLGPVVGRVTVTATQPGVIVPRGMIGQLPDGRLVRVRNALRLRSATDGYALDCRLLFLTPAFPVVGNFAPITATTVVTWRSPPAHLAATGVVATDFAKSTLVLESGAPVAQLQSLGDESAAPNLEGTFAAGQNGAAAAYLIDPDEKAIAGGQLAQRFQTMELTYKLRVNLSDLAQPTVVRQAQIRDIRDALYGLLMGATVGSLDVWISSMRRVRTKGATTSYELAFVVRAVTDGRNLVFRPTAPPLTTVGIDIVVNDDGAQPSPFEVKDDITTT